MSKRGVAMLGGFALILLVLLVMWWFLAPRSTSDLSMARPARPRSASGEQARPLAGSTARKSLLPPAEARWIIEDRAHETIAALKDRDMEALAVLTHPIKGVRFSPYGYVDLGRDLVFTPAELRTVLSGTQLYDWGNNEGSGQDLRYSFAAYLDRFVYGRDFAIAPEVGYNEFLGVGTTRNNLEDVYPLSITVEYHFPGVDEAFGGLDWESLRLVFDLLDGRWYLVGIIHDAQGI